MRIHIFSLGLVIATGVVTAAMALWKSEPSPGSVLDEALQGSRDAPSMAAADEDYFKDMDGQLPLSPGEIKGRNTWLVWSGGNDRFWDQISKKSVGTLDFIKTVSSYDPARESSLSPDRAARLKQSYRHVRSNRFAYLGLINEPCFEQAPGPDPTRFGLWLDRRRADCAPDPFENENKYPGIKLGARGKSMPVASLYGYASGIVGLRLFPNPDFDEAAAKRWDPVRYYADPSYYQSKDLVLPYRVGMSCAFCHVGPNPVHPPADPENPRWADLSSNVGAQYFWVDRIFSWENDPSSFPFQLFHTARPGTLDTSLVSTDYINNPRTMNAVYALDGRLDAAKRWGKEVLADGSLGNQQFQTGPLAPFFVAPDTVYTPHVLKDGSDSVGVLGALNRVYLNIGLFSEEWLLHFNALVGGKPISAITIASARKNSPYWNATEARSPDLASFLIKSASPHRLRDAPSGASYLTEDPATLRRGKEVFADRCARCHSSKLPAAQADVAGCAGPKYLECWQRYWDWTKTDDFRQPMRALVASADFLDGNLLSTDMRVPVTLLETNACSPLATNAIAGNIWDNFSSQSYKSLPSVGEVTIHHPITGERSRYKMPAGGRGYIRPASLVSLWSTAPFLLNNSVGRFEPLPSVEARMRSFQDSIEQMLWPERRQKDPVLGDKVPGIIDRTTTQSFLRVPAGYLPELLRPLLGFGQRWFPSLIGDGGVEIGPIPAGTPINLLANLELVGEDRSLEQRVLHGKKVLALLARMKGDLAALPAGASDAEARKVFANLVEPMLELSKCPDFVVNRGHYFGTSQFAEEPGLSDDDKRALIGFLKTF